MQDYGFRGDWPLTDCDSPNEWVKVKPALAHDWVCE